MAEGEYKVVVLRCRRDNVRTASPWAALSDELITVLSTSVVEDVVAANMLVNAGWRLRSVADITNNPLYDKELWFDRE